jgi:two-component system response regulator DctR
MLLCRDAETEIKMPRPHVIVIDDDPAASASVVALLEAFDFDVTSFDSAETFLAAEQALEWKCLILDVHLSGMSGRHLLKKLRQEKIQMPVILVSGYANSTTSTELLEDGAFAVLEKPIEPSILVAEIQRALEDQNREA